MEYLQKGRALVMEQDLKKAYEHFVAALNCSPELKASVGMEFRALLSRVADMHFKENSPQVLFFNLEQAKALYPDSAHILNDIGRYLFKFGQIAQALAHFERALDADSSIASIQRHSNIMKRVLLPRWYIRIFNDRVKNQAYATAIQNTVSCNDKVIDIDADIGLLSIYANNCRPAPMSVTACEGTQALAKMAETIVEDSILHLVTVLNTLPTTLPRVADNIHTLLLTDKFGPGFLGFYMYESLTYAWERLMAKDARVIPNKAEYLIIGAKCDTLNQKYQLNPWVLKQLGISDLNVHIHNIDNETYYGEDININRDLQYVTDETSVITVNLNDYEDIKKKFSVTDSEIHHVELTANKEMEINTLIGFFKLYLTDDVTITTDPRCEGRSRAWKQACFFDMPPTKMKKGEKKLLKFSSVLGNMSYIPDLKKIYRISIRMLQFLNDIEYMKVISESMAIARTYLGQFVNIEETDIVDLCPFPFFGILMLKSGARSLICSVKTKRDKRFLTKILKINNISREKVTIMMHEYWSDDVFYKNVKVHALFCHLLDNHGDIDAHMKRAQERLAAQHLIEGGLSMPYGVTLVGQAVSCAWLDNNNRVCDTNMHTVKVARVVNRYQTTQAPCLDLDRLEYVALTKPLAILYDTYIAPDVFDIPILVDGELNGFLCWYRIQLLSCTGEVETCHSNSMADVTAFLVDRKRQLYKDDNLTVIFCVDPDGTFKFV